ncbi:MAG TPA: COX15/CtaA family protein [Candidatus Thermoplasmatota archaeon]|jgi:cytochrome c oxidase assembly protein subunit 15|nr:COX15/CtaA family protein [Candidatus Thermoplasmatota archaeon]
MAQGERLFRALALLTVGLVYSTIVAGAYVRGSGSGLGCSHWPGCEPGQFFPDAANVHALIEWTHRTVAALAGFAILATFLAAIRYKRHDRRLLLAATAAFLLLPVQAGLGAVTVFQGLNPVFSAAHMGVAAALFGAIVATAIFAHIGPRPVRVEEAEAPSFRAGRGDAPPVAGRERA